MRYFIEKDTNGLTYIQRQEYSYNEIVVSLPEETLAAKEQINKNVQCYGCFYVNIAGDLICQLQTPESKSYYFWFVPDKQWRLLRIA